MKIFITKFFNKLRIVLLKKCSSNVINDMLLLDSYIGIEHGGKPRFWPRRVITIEERCKQSGRKFQQYIPQRVREKERWRVNHDKAGRAHQKEKTEVLVCRHQHNACRIAKVLLQNLNKLKLPIKKRCL